MVPPFNVRYWIPNRPDYLDLRASAVNNNPPSKAVPGLTRKTASTPTLAGLQQTWTVYHSTPAYVPEGAQRGAGRAGWLETRPSGSRLTWSLGLKSPQGWQWLTETIHQSPWMARLGSGAIPPKTRWGSPSAWATLEPEVFDAVFTAGSWTFAPRADDSAPLGGRRARMRRSDLTMDDAGPIAHRLQLGRRQTPCWRRHKRHLAHPRG